ncbi:MAG: single-stranded-DNA-specific exonuclease RecJ [Pontiellaceae bacterium]|nr:single-stranded-DNA-specific exonuclease RecJ [Pontiellaceae bacterium]
MRIPQKKWESRTTDPEKVRDLVAAMDIPAPIAHVLITRGFSTEEDVADFLRPPLAKLEDPFLLPDMEKAVQRIWRAVDAQEYITVFGDYDVDGVTAAALMIRVLNALGARVDGFVPDRLEEGYGLSADAVERCLASRDVQLLVTVDCGTNSVESVAYAQGRGVDVVVTDHHEPEEQIADAYALINPKLGTFGGYLAGVGVAFKLAHALVLSGSERAEINDVRSVLRSVLDLVALGTVTDIVPLVGENRTLVRHGLLQMESTEWVGMQALKEVAAIKGELNTGHLGFQLGPRINAAGRIGEPEQAVRLLTTDDFAEARTIAKLLDRDNQERRTIERKMADEAFEEIDRYYDPVENFGLVVARKGWHPGVVGIVASRVARHYNRPAVIMGVEPDGSARGSCRSIEAFDLLEGLQACAEHLGQFGGHRMAAGLEIAPNALEAFKSAFNLAARQALEQVDLSPVQLIDAVVEADDLDWEFWEKLKQLCPFGQDNPEPVWALLNMQVAGVPQVVGEKHLKFSVSDGEHTFDAIAFGYPLEALPAGKIDLAFVLKENQWHGSSSLQLQVKDIRPAQ